MPSPAKLGRWQCIAGQSKAIVSAVRPIWNKKTFYDKSHIKPSPWLKMLCPSLLSLSTVSSSGILFPTLFLGSCFSLTVSDSLRKTPYYLPGPTEVTLVPTGLSVQRFLQNNRVIGPALQETIWTLKLKAPHETKKIFLKRKIYLRYFMLKKNQKHRRKNAYIYAFHRFFFFCLSMSVS